MATGPAWNAWVGELVPSRVRTRFFAVRTRWLQASLVLSVVCAGLAIEHGRETPLHLALFGALFAFSCVARLASSFVLASQSDPPGIAASMRMIPARDVTSHLRGTDAARLLAYLIGMQIAVQIAGPFFTPYMLGPLALSYADLMVITSVAFLARIAAMPLLSRAVARFGVRRVLFLGAVGIVPLPVMWLPSHQMAWLICVQIFAGVSWAAVEYATQLAIFESIRAEDRASVLTAFNLAHTVALALGSMLGAGMFALAQTQGWHGETPYALLYAASTCARVMALGLLRGVTPAPVPVTHVPQDTEAIRPSWGAVQRPILATLDSEEEGGGGTR
jgi:hypothetical protein